MRRVLGRIAGISIVRKAAVSTPFVRDVAWRFVAGEDLAAGLATVRTLNARGIAATLNHVGTHVADPQEAAAATDAVIQALDGIRAAGVDSHLSLKLTQIGLDVDPELCRSHLWRVLGRARDHGIFVRIDMEESRYVQATLDLFDEARDRVGSEHVGIVIQSYLRHRRDDLPRLVAAGARIRLVKGGYWESPEVVLGAKADIDRVFAADIETLMRGAVDPAIATHDPIAIEVARHAAMANGREPGAFEFQMLMGVRSDLQDRLVGEGFRVRCYVPYGGQWYAYVLGCLRRMPEGIVRRLRERVRPSPLRQEVRVAATTRRAALAVKRGMDIVGALAGLVVLAPVLLWAAVAVAVAMGRPILFRQRRPGRNGRPFTILKFRTMRPVSPGQAAVATDAERVTRLGRILRATSIDELPELWNVLRGEMSLVGPRPLLVEYLRAYSPREARRHEMRPGVTGWAAVSGRHTLPFEARLELDVWYVEHWSLWLDIRILARTVRYVLGRRAVLVTQAPSDIAMPERFRAVLDQGAAPAWEGDASARVDQDAESGSSGAR